VSKGGYLILFHFQRLEAEKEKEEWKEKEQKG
jgi:hypothetical protein